MVAILDSTPATTETARRADTVVTVCPKCRAAYRAREIPSMPKFSRTRGKDGLCTVWFDCSCGTGLNAIEQRGRLLSAEESAALARASGIPATVPAQSHFATARASLPSVYSSGGERPSYSAASEAFKAARAALSPTPSPLPRSPDSIVRSDVQERMERLANGIGGPALAKLRAGRLAPSATAPVQTVYPESLTEILSTLSAGVSEIDRFLTDLMQKQDPDVIDLLAAASEVQSSLVDVRDNLQKCESSARSLEVK